MLNWSMYHPKCKSCGTTETPHHALGLCTACYHRQYKRPKPNKALENARAVGWEIGRTFGQDETCSAATHLLERFGLAFHVSNDILYVNTPEGSLSQKL